MNHITWVNLIVLLCYGHITEGHEIAIIDFEDLGIPPGTQIDPPDRATTSSGGFDFKSGFRSTIRDLHFSNDVRNTLGGTTEMLAHEEVIMTKNEGGLFTLLQFQWGSFLKEEPAFTVEGTLSGGGIVSQTFMPYGDTSTYQIFTLDNDFRNLVSVIWKHYGGNNGGQNIDNIYVLPIPEPTTLTLATLAMIPGAMLRRR